MLVFEEVLIECVMIAATVIGALMLVYMVVGLVRGREDASAARRRDQAHHYRRVDHHRRAA